jgi:serine/threonine-protein kinase
MKDTNIGRLLANRYRLSDFIGEGAMGRVYRGEDTKLGDVTVAIKFLSHTLLNQKMRERFEREATISALLGEKSIHIVRVRDSGVDDNEIPYYVMEFLQGDPLSDIVEYEPLPLPRFLNIIRQICLGMESAHQGIFYKGEYCPIIHRDIKPSNILILQDPSLGELVKILDFGIAKLIQTSATMTNSFMGTLAYCSPEQMDGKELDSRSDIYSLGIMMYEMLTGDMPLIPENPSFGGWYKIHHYGKPDPFEPALKIPPALEKLVMKCLAKSPDERPQTVSEIWQTLEPISQKDYPSTASIKTSPKQEIEEDTTQVSGSSIDRICLQSAWPSDKPQQKIVFPRLMRDGENVFATLWVMLDAQDIANRRSSICYNQFLFLTKPHPMLLWITVLHNQEYGPRWLPCYLDMKTAAGQKIAQILGENGSYCILFFALNDPQHCQNVMTSNIAHRQCLMLKDWAATSQTVNSSGPTQISKKMLKQEFEQLKSKILMKLEAVQTNYPTDLLG